METNQDFIQFQVLFQASHPTKLQTLICPCYFFLSIQFHKQVSS